MSRRTAATSGEKSEARNVSTMRTSCGESSDLTRARGSDINHNPIFREHVLGTERAGERALSQGPGRRPIIPLHRIPRPHRRERDLERERVPAELLEVEVLEPGLLPG